MSGSNRSAGSPALDQGLAVLAAVILCCFIVGILTFSWGRDSERDSQRAAEYQDYRERRVSAFCADLSGTLLAKCQIEQEQAAREAYQSERDLEAQRDMSLWALAVFIIGFVTAGLTLWALWYVRGTLLATREALDDTGKATFAMVDANRIAANAQRPWVTMDAKVVDFERVSPVAFSVTWEVTFANTGQMLAENFHLQTQLVPMGHNFLETMAEWFDRYEANVIERDAVLVPGQTTTSGGKYGYSIEHLPWEMKKGFRKDCVLMVLAMARYRIPGDKTWRLALRGFSIGVNNSYVDNRYFIYDSLDELSLEKLLVQPMGRSRAT
jgi:hypothetical protein